MVAGQADVEQDESSTAPIDRRYLARFTLGDVALEREILRLFAGELPLYMRRLEAAVTREDWKFAAHTIKGSALAVGARRLAGLAQVAEGLDWDAEPVDRERLRLQAVAAVAGASDEACCYIAGLFAAD